MGVLNGNGCFHLGGASRMCWSLRVAATISGAVIAINLPDGLVSRIEN